MHRSGSTISWHDHGPDPDEFYEKHDVDGASPEKRLRLAVLLNAITHLKRGGRRSAAEEAARWIRGEQDAMHVSFSFRAICETLDLDAETLAVALLRADAEGPKTAHLPRRQVRTQRLYGMARRYRPRRSGAAGEADAGG
jgi:hypothetical protein